MLWKRRWAADCRPFNFGRNEVDVNQGTPVYAQAMPGVFTVEEVCETYGDVIGYDARTGTDRWKVSVAEAARGLPGVQGVVHRSDFTVMDCLSDVDGRLLALCIENYGAALIDSTSGRVVARRYTGDPDDRKTPGVGDHVNEQAVRKLSRAFRSFDHGFEHVRWVAITLLSVFTTCACGVDLVIGEPRSFGWPSKRWRGADGEENVRNG